MNHLSADNSHEMSFLIWFLGQQQTLKVLSVFCGHANLIGSALIIGKEMCDLYCKHSEELGLNFYTEDTR